MVASVAHCSMEFRLKMACRFTLLNSYDHTVIITLWSRSGSAKCVQDFKIFKSKIRRLQLHVHSNFFGLQFFSPRIQIVSLPRMQQFKGDELLSFVCVCVEKNKKTMGLSHHRAQNRRPHHKSSRSYRAKIAFHLLARDKRLKSECRTSVFKWIRNALPVSL